MFKEKKLKRKVKTPEEQNSLWLNVVEYMLLYGR